MPAASRGHNENECGNTGLALRKKRRYGPQALGMARWRSGYAEDCKSTCPPGVPSVSAEISVLLDTAPCRVARASAENRAPPEPGEGGVSDPWKTLDAWCEIEADRVGRSAARMLEREGYNLDHPDYRQALGQSQAYHRMRSFIHGARKHT